MEKNQNPVNSKGKKNVFCPYYRNCLDHAAKNYWEFWSCFECSHKLVLEPCTQMLVARSGSTQSYTLPPGISRILNI